jgi:lipopolysaccharide biosynthesis regulator YciM
MSEVKDEVKVDDKPAKEAKAAKAEQKKVRVIIHSGESDADKGDVPLAHNYRQILIQRDKEVLVDEVFLEVLKHATMQTTFKDENGVMRTATVPRFSFTVSPA